jgi:hypothetical protein
VSMATLIRFLDFRDRAARPTLVLVGLHRFEDTEANLPRCTESLSACKDALAAARSAGLSIAHVRRLTAPASLHAWPSYPSWLPGFEPMRSDMVFDVLQPSCYSSVEFSQAMEYSRGNFAIAGHFGETMCLSTAIEAYHRKHLFTYLPDASKCQPPGQISPEIYRDALTHIIALYGEVMDSAAWAQSLQQRSVAW